MNENLVINLEAAVAMCLAAILGLAAIMISDFEDKHLH